MENTTRSFWGPIFKDKCGVCLQDSGWVTIGQSNAWAKYHYVTTLHYKFSRFMKKCYVDKI